MNYEYILNKDYGELRLPTTDDECITRECEQCKRSKRLNLFNPWGNGYRHICKDCETFNKQLEKHRKEYEEVVNKTIRRCR